MDSIPSAEVPKSDNQSLSNSKANAVRIWIDIRITNGLHLFQKNLSYCDLVRMIKKLEVLC